MLFRFAAAVDSESRWSTAALTEVSPVNAPRYPPPPPPVHSVEHMPATWMSTLVALATVGARMVATTRSRPAMNGLRIERVPVQSVSPDAIHTDQPVARAREFKS